MIRLNRRTKRKAQDTMQPIERRMRKQERQSIRRELKNKTLKVEAAIVVADKGVIEDLERLIPTFMYYMPEHIPLYLAGDIAAITRAIAISHELGVSHRLHVRQWIDDASIEEAKNRLQNLTNVADYWKPGQIWWKLEALRLVSLEVKGGVLLLDSDIVLTSPFQELEFQDIDAALSPFYWSDPEFPTQQHSETNERIPIANRDGHLNAGFILIGRPEVAAFWKQLYELGVGGFYEQWCMKYLVNEFHCGYFSYLHNFGSWRRERPPRDCRSVHVHATTRVKAPWHIAIQELADSATEQSRRTLLKKKSPEKIQ